MILVSDLEIEWTKKAGIRRDKMTLFESPLELNHGYITRLERTPDDGLKIRMLTENESNLDSRYELTLDRDDLQKLLKFINE